MKHAALKLASALCVLLTASNAEAQYAYPTRGQSQATQAKDEAECSHWATDKTGYDPGRPPPTAAAQPAPVTGSGSRARGAAGGAAIGAMAGNAGAGAAAGAVAGGVSRRVANRRAADAQSQATAQQAQSAQASYAQARGACLSGRGYSVK